MTKDIELFTQNSIKIMEGDRRIYIDPFQMRREPQNADFILITHDHYDHFSPKDIAKVASQSTILVVPETMAEKAKEGDPDALLLFDEFGQNMGALLCTVMYAYDPTHIALAGGIANNYPFFRQAMEEYIRANFPYRKAVERLTLDICTDDNIPVLGASLI